VKVVLSFLLIFLTKVLIDPSEDVHKVLDKLFVVMEESARHRNALHFPEVQPVPNRSPLADSLAMLSCIFYIPCGFTTMLAGWAIDNTDPSLS